MNNQGSGGGPQLETAMDSVGHKMGGLRRQLRRAVVDHVSDLFIETDGPLLRLIEAAVSGSEAKVDEASLVFSQHAAKLVEVANLACSMSTNEEGVKMVRHAASQIQNLCPQVSNGCILLTSWHWHIINIRLSTLLRYCPADPRAKWLWRTWKCSEPTGSNNCNSSQMPWMILCRWRSVRY